MINLKKETSPHPQIFPLITFKFYLFLLAAYTILLIMFPDKLPCFKNSQQQNLAILLGDWKGIVDLRSELPILLTRI